MVKGDLAVMNKLGVMMQRPCYRFLKWVPHSSIEKDREIWPETVNRLYSGSRTEVTHCQSQGPLAASKTDKARTGISARAGREEEPGQHFDVSLRRLIVNSQLLEMDKKSICVLIPRTCYATTKKTLIHPRMLYLLPRETDGLQKSSLPFFSLQPRWQNSESCTRWASTLARSCSLMPLQALPESSTKHKASCWTLYFLLSAWNLDQASGNIRH